VLIFFLPNKKQKAKQKAKQKSNKQKKINNKNK